MSRFDVTYWTAYVNVIKDALGLKDWTVWVVEDRPSDHDTNGEYCAEVEPTRGRKEAVLRFSDLFFDMAPYRQRHTVVHECLHCHLDNIKRAYEDGMNTRVHPDVFDTVYANIILHYEIGIDGIATVIAPFFPIPEAA